MVMAALFTIVQNWKQAHVHKQANIVHPYNQTLLMNEKGVESWGNMLSK